MKRTAVALTLIIALLSSVVVGAMLVKTAIAKTITVPYDYPTIQGAINAASSGDTVFVKSGVYPENLEINKSISVIGENRNSTIIDAHGLDGHVVLIQHASHVTFSNFTLGNAGIPTGTSYASNDGIKIDLSDYASIINNTIIDIPGGNGIYVDASDAIITGNTILNVSYCAIQVWYNNNSVLNNQYANVDGGAFGPIFNGGSNNTFEGNHQIALISMPSPFPVPEFSSSIILPLFMIATLIATTIYFKKRKRLT